jgi:hypothetical protein
MVLLAQVLLLLTTAFTVLAMGYTTYAAARLGWRLVKQRRDRGRTDLP